MCVFWKLDARKARRRFHDALAALHMQVRAATGYGRDELSLVVRVTRDYYRIADNVRVDVAAFQRLRQKAAAASDVG